MALGCGEESFITIIMTICIIIRPLKLNSLFPIYLPQACYLYSAHKNDYWLGRRKRALP